MYATSQEFQMHCVCVKQTHANINCCPFFNLYTKCTKHRDRCRWFWNVKYFFQLIIHNTESVMAWRWISKCKLCFTMISLTGIPSGVHMLEDKLDSWSNFRSQDRLELQVDTAASACVFFIALLPWHLHQGTSLKERQEIKLHIFMYSMCVCWQTEMRQNLTCDLSKVEFWWEVEARGLFLEHLQMRLLCHPGLCCRTGREEGKVNANVKTSIKIYK